MQIHLVFPPASSSSPSVENEIDEKQHADACAAKVLLSEFLRPPTTSRRPSIVPTRFPSMPFQMLMWPSRDDDAICLPSGRNVTARTSEECCSVIVALLVSKTSQSLTVLSHELLASTGCSGLNSRLETGPSCPASTSRRRAVFMDHTKISKVSWVPAHTISSEGSMASERNCVGLGVTSVRKLRYRTRSKARTEPSRLADTTALPLRRNFTVSTDAAWSTKVMKQKPVVPFQTLTFPSEPPVTICEPFGE
mmetsp:Transcript_16962/g.40664  ORF Transcript_16962/g.40664 Transcript_16962/m.40664 type:complete len:251 (-) Transcript_16962:717-1469(-)